MSGFAWLSAGCLVLLALAHSVLGEQAILRPLFRSAWDEPGPRWAMERILRFAWHLTSMAWLALAAVLVGAPVGGAVAVLGLVSSATVFVMLRGHLAWPLFLGVGVGGLALQGWLTTWVLVGCVALAVPAVLLVAAVHVYWAAGGRRGLAAAIPVGADGAPVFRPPVWATAAVAVGMTGLAGMLVWTATGAAPGWVHAVVAIAGVAMVVRAVGDGRRVGFTKTERVGAFARWDDALFSPLVVLFAMGSGAALMVG